MPEMRCVIDDCRNPVRFHLHSYPDDVDLCSIHVALHPAESLHPWERLVRLETAGDRVRAVAAATSEETPRA